MWHWYTNSYICAPFSQRDCSLEIIRWSYSTLISYTLHRSHFRSDPIQVRAKQYPALGTKRTLRGSASCEVFSFTFPILIQYLTCLLNYISKIHILTRFVKAFEAFFTRFVNFNIHSILIIRSNTFVSVDVIKIMHLYILYKLCINILC